MEEEEEEEERGFRETIGREEKAVVILGYTMLCSVVVVVVYTFLHTKLYLFLKGTRLSERESRLVLYILLSGR